MSGATRPERRTLTTAVATPVDLLVPAGNDPASAVMVLHDLSGPAAAVPLARRLAASGHIAAIPHHLVRARPGDGAADSPAWGVVRGISDIEVLNDLAALLEALAAHPRCSGRMGAVGLGVGGRLGVLLATSPSAPERVVACYPPGLVKSTALYDPLHPQIPVQRVQRLKSAFLGVVAENDPDPSPAHAAELDALMAHVPGAVHRLMVVPGTRHGFLDGVADGGVAEAAVGAIEVWLSALHRRATTGRVLPGEGG